MKIAPSHRPAIAAFRPPVKDKAIRRCSGPVFAAWGLMRFVFLTTAGMINAERFTILPTHRTNFKRGPDPAV